MLNIQFSPFPDLHTSRLQLRRVTEDDANEIFFLRTDPEVQRYIDRPRPKSLEDTVTYINEMNALMKKNDVVLWGIALNNDAKLIGYVCLFRIEHENYRCEIGYLLHPAYHKKGMMTEVLTAVLEYAFASVQFHTITANVNPGNLASMSLLRNLGFVQEGYFKENFFHNGKFLDTVIFSKINPSHSSNSQ